MANTTVTNSHSSVPASSPVSAFSSIPASSSIFVPPPTSSAAVTNPTSVETLPTSTTVVAVTSTFFPPSSLVLVTSVVTQNPATTGGTQPPTVLVVTSTAAAPVQPSTYVYSSTSVFPTGSSSSSTSKASALSTSSAVASTSSGGLSSGGTIAVAVVVPIVAIALIVIGLLFLWRRRKARKTAEEQRRKEIEEYGFNPNNDPHISAVGGAASYGEPGAEMAEDNSGYRGWGNTVASTGRKTSTNHGSGKGNPVGSETGSNPGGYGQQGSPSHATANASEGHSGDPLVAAPNLDGEFAPEPVGELGGAAAGVAAGHSHSNKDIRRGPSNASSAYSAGQAQSDASEIESGIPPGNQGSYYPEDGPYYSEALPQHGPYGDGSYSGGPQPVIRDVQARRNTRIEPAPTYPQPGNSGIAQNF